jgi:hypothetical protein
MIFSKKFQEMRKQLEKQLKDLDTQEAKAAKRQKKLAKKLATLPEAYGFDNVTDFVRAVKYAAKGGKINKGSSSKRRKRAVITDETREMVKKLNEVGKTNNEISTELGISVPTVQNIKKHLGLVKERK